MEKTDKTVRAEAALAKAIGLKAAREKAATAITGDLDAARAEVARFDALPELDAPSHLADQNARKRVRHLTAQLASAGAAIAQAEEAVEAAQRQVDVATLRDLDADLHRRDRELVAAFATVSAEWQEKRAALLADLSRAHSIDESLRPDRSALYHGGHRNCLVAMHPPRMGVLEVAAAVLAGEQVKRQAALVESQMRAAAARNTPYRPPFGEFGEPIVDEQRPLPEGKRGH